MTPDVRDKEPAASPTVRPIRMVVADIAYDDVVVAGREFCSVKALVRGINGSSVAVDGVRISTAAAWSEVFARALEGLGAVDRRLLPAAILDRTLLVTTHRGPGKCCWRRSGCPPM